MSSARHCVQRPRHGTSVAWAVLATLPGFSLLPPCAAIRYRLASPRMRCRVQQYGFHGGRGVKYVNCIECDWELVSRNIDAVFLCVVRVSICPLACNQSTRELQTSNTFTLSWRWRRPRSVRNSSQFMIGAGGESPSLTTRNAMFEHASECGIATWAPSKREGESRRKHELPASPSSAFRHIYTRLHELEHQLGLTTWKVVTT